MSGSGLYAKEWIASDVYIRLLSEKLNVKNDEKMIKYN